MSVGTYSAGEVILTVGNAVLSGFADGTFISVERDEQSFTKVVGADGKVSRAKSNNRSGTLTVTLLDTSPSNDVLSEYLRADEASNEGTFEIEMKDLSGRSRIFSAVGWVQGMPTLEFAKENSEREWVIELGEMEFFIGGNTQVNS